MVNAALNGSVYELVIPGMLGKIIDNDFCNGGVGVVKGEVMDAYRTIKASKKFSGGGWVVVVGWNQIWEIYEA